VLRTLRNDLPVSVFVFLFVYVWWCLVGTMVSLCFVFFFLSGVYGMEP